MSLQRPRYIHVQTKGGHRKGFSAEIAPFYPHDGKTCHFRITFCNSTDAFCRHEARAALQLKEWQEVRIVDVPQMLAEAENLCYYKEPLKSLYGPKMLRLRQNAYAWVWKYFL